MKRLSALWARLPNLPRSWRIVRNLFLAAVLAAGLTALLNWPALSPYRAFQRVEGAYLLTPSRLVLQVEDSWGAGFLTEGDSWIAAGGAMRMDNVPSPLDWDVKYSPYLSHVLPKEGLVVVVLPARNEQIGFVGAVWGAPPDAAWGTLDLDLIDLEDPFGTTRYVPQEETFTAQAQRREDGWFIFQFAPHDSHPQGTLCAMRAFVWGGRFYPVGELPYRLSLTDSQGTEVASQAGTLPPDQNLCYYR